MKPDTTYLYFKPSGKWKYEGRGVFPSTFEVDRGTIMGANDGKMPGISSNGQDYIIVVLPDDDCSSPYAYPRMLHPV